MTPDELRAIRERWPEERCANSDARADVLALLDEVERLTGTLQHERAVANDAVRDMHAANMRALLYEQQRDEARKIANDAVAEINRLNAAICERDSARDRILEYTDALVERDAEIASLTAALDERDVEAERVREQYDALAAERDEARAEVERLEVACHAWAEDMREAARLCEQAGNEMPIDAVRRFVSSKAAIVDMLQDRLSESRAEVERLMHQLADATNESTHFQVMCKRETEEVERLTSELQRERIGIRPVDEVRSDAYRRGAEAMRDECIGAACGFFMGTTGFCNGDEDELEAVLEALPIPEEP